MKSALSFRPATIADAPAALDLTRQAYAKWVPLIGREPKPMQADYVKAIAEHRVDLAYQERDLAGLIETIVSFDHLLIENVAVAPAFQGQGFGRQLMAHAERLAMASGKNEIRLYTNKRFVENVELYLRLGYRIDREEELSVGTAVHMSKQLS